MSYYTKKNPPPNQWIELVKQSVYEIGSIEWKESNAGNILRTWIHACGYWEEIEYIYPEPDQENDWLYDFDTGFYAGYFITQYEGLYGYWSNDYAYRSHYFNISIPEKWKDYYTGDNLLQLLSDAYTNVENPIRRAIDAYYTAGDPPQFLINAFADQDLEVVPWDMSLSKEHPLLQKAKAECETLNLPFSKALATRIWNKSTPDTFITEWEVRKIKYQKEQIKKFLGIEALKYISNKNRGGVAGQKGNTYENFFAVYQLAHLSKSVIENHVAIYISSQTLAFVDDLIVDVRGNTPLRHYQLKNMLDVSWGAGLKSISDDFSKQHILNQTISRESEITLVVPDEKLKVKLNNIMPHEIKAFSQVFCFPYELTIIEVIQKCEDFRMAIMYLSAFDNPPLDKIECVATVLLGAWVSSQKSNISIAEILRKAQLSTASFIRSFKHDLELDPKVKEILDSVQNFTYNISKGFLHWQFQQRSYTTKATFPHSLETDEFRRFQARVKRYKPTTFEELEDFL